MDEGRRLLSAATKLLWPESQGIDEAERTFIELLTFSTGEEIVHMLDEVLQRDWAGFPVWARNLSFRLACLLRPDDRELLLRAAADLRCFGPDWDDESDALRSRANKP